MTERVTLVHKWETVWDHDEETGRTLIHRVPVEWTDEEIGTEGATVPNYEPEPGVCSKCGEHVGALYISFFGPDELMCAKCAGSYGPNGKVVKV